MSERLTVTEDVVLDGTEYEPRPGTLYEIAPGVIGRLRSAQEDVIEAYEATDEAYQALVEEKREAIEQGGAAALAATRELDKKARAFTYDKCAAILEVVEGIRCAC